MSKQPTAATTEKFGKAKEVVKRKLQQVHRQKKRQHTEPPPPPPLRSLASPKSCHREHGELDFSSMFHIKHESREEEEDDDNNKNEEQRQRQQEEEDDEDDDDDDYASGFIPATQSEKIRKSQRRRPSSSSSLIPAVDEKKKRKKKKKRKQQRRLPLISSTSSTGVVIVAETSPSSSLSGSDEQQQQRHPVEEKHSEEEEEEEGTEFLPPPPPPKLVAYSPSMTDALYEKAEQHIEAIAMGCRSFMDGVVTAKLKRLAGIRTTPPESTAASVNSQASPKLDQEQMKTMAESLAILVTLKSMYGELQDDNTTDDAKREIIVKMQQLVTSLEITSLGFITDSSQLTNLTLSQ